MNAFRTAGLDAELVANFFGCRASLPTICSFVQANLVGEPLASWLGGINKQERDYMLTESYSTFLSTHQFTTSWKTQISVCLNNLLDSKLEVSIVM